MTKKILVVAIVAVTLFALIGCDVGYDDVKCEYDVKLYYDDAEKTLSCFENVKFTNNTGETLEDIAFSFYPLAFGEKGNVANESAGAAYPFGVNYAKTDISAVRVRGNDASYTVGEELPYITLALDRPLANKKSVDVEIEFSVKLPKNRLRFGYNSTSVNLGNFLPLVAVRKSGEWVKERYYLNGDPFYSGNAKFDVTLEVDSKLSAVMTGDAECKEAGGKKTYRSVADNVRDFAAVISENGKVLTKEENGITFNYLHSGDGDPAKSLDTAVRAIEVFSDKFGEYGYASFSMAETDFSEGGMEYPTLIYIAKGLGELDRERVIVHEVAHEWWYGIVGVDEVNDYFIDEGLAEYSTALYYRAVGEEKFADTLLKIAKNSYVTYYADIKSDERDESMGRHLSLIGNTEYYHQAYNKSMLTFEFISNTMGEKDFIARLRSIVKKYRHKNISREQFMKEFGKYGDLIESFVCGKSVF